MKPVYVVVLILTLCNGVWCDLQSHYKKGTIVLKEVPGYGAGNDWAGLFYDPYKDMVAAPDGSIFVSNSRTHNVYKFDRQGKWIKTFGRRGQGPTDFNSPGDLSILDNTYLLVNDFYTNRRISLWNLEGEHIKVVKIDKVDYLTALRNNRLAYYFPNQYAEAKNDYQAVYSIVIKDIGSGKEKLLRKVTLLDRSEIILGPGMSTVRGNFFGEVFLFQARDGNLGVGVSNQPAITIYSPSGDKLTSFSLKIAPVAVTKKYISKFRDHVLADLKKEGEMTLDATRKFWHEQYMKTLPKFDFSNIFDRYLPLYKEILVDGEGNFLIFKYIECQGDCPPIFQVYSPKGEFICETALDMGKYDLDIDRRFKRLCFTKEGIFALVTEKGDEDEILRLIKSNYLPNP